MIFILMVSMPVMIRVNYLRLLRNSPVPSFDNQFELANVMWNFFEEKITKIHSKLDSIGSVNESTHVPNVTPNILFDQFTPLTEIEVKQLVGKSTKKSCSLDPMPTKLVNDCLDMLLPVLTDHKPIYRFWCFS